MPAHLSDRVFLIANAPADPGWGLDLIAKIAGNGLVYAGVVLIAALWIWGRPERRAGLLAAMIGVSIALGVNQVLGMLWYDSHPLVLGLGHTLIHHATDNSLPRDHATFMWALGFGLVETAAARRWGVLVCLIGLVLAWARIYFSIHYPIDMGASVAVGVIGGLIARSLVPPMQQWLCPFVAAAYHHALILLHLPEALFPRAGERIRRSEPGCQI